MGAALLSPPLFRVFPREDADAKVEAKEESSTTASFREPVEGLETSNWRGNLTGLRDTFFFPFPRDGR